MDEATKKYLIKKISLFKETLLNIKSELKTILEFDKKKEKEYDIKKKINIIDGFILKCDQLDFNDDVIKQIIKIINDWNQIIQEFNIFDLKIEKKDIISNENFYDIELEKLYSNCKTDLRNLFIEYYDEKCSKYNFLDFREKIDFDYRNIRNNSDEIQKKFNIFILNIYKKSYEHYRIIAKYLNNYNLELYENLKPRTRRNVGSFKDILDILEFYNKLEENNLKSKKIQKIFDETKIEENNFVFFLGQEFHYKNILSNFEKINSFYYIFKKENVIYHFFNILAFKSDFNQLSTSTYLDAKYFIENSLKNIIPKKIFLFGLCAGFDSLKTNDILFPEIFNSMYIDGKFLKITSSDLLKIKDKNQLKINNIFSDLDTKNFSKENSIFRKTKNISVSNLYAKEVYFDNIFVDIAKKIYGKNETDKINNLIQEKIDKRFDLGSKYLSKKFNSLEMETYAILNDYKNIDNIGVFLQAADVIDTKKNEHNIYGNDGNYALPLDKELFNKNILNILNYYFNK